MQLYRILKSIMTHPLNADDKIDSLIRFAKWQFGSRLISDDIVLHEWINGAKFLVRRGEIGLTGNIYTGLYDFEEMGFLLHVVNDGDLFVDVGANAGAYTILACAVAGAEGYAFEPGPDAYQRLKSNVHVNRLENRVRLFNSAVGEKDGSVCFSVDLDTTNRVVIGDPGIPGTMTSTMVMLDTVLKGNSPSLIKIDVEGYELKVLEGAKEIFSSESLFGVIMELNSCADNYGFNHSKVVEAMYDYGFSVFRYSPFTRQLVKIPKQKGTTENTLFIRNERDVLDRIRKAPLISVNGKKF